MDGKMIFAIVALCLSIILTTINVCLIRNHLKENKRHENVLKAMLQEEIKTYSTKELVEELKDRQAVQDIWIPPYEEFEIKANGEGIDTAIKEGACYILIVWD